MESMRYIGKLLLAGSLLTVLAGAGLVALVQPAYDAHGCRVKALNLLLLSFLALVSACALFQSCLNFKSAPSSSEADGTMC